MEVGGELRGVMEQFGLFPLIALSLVSLSFRFSLVTSRDLSFRNELPKMILLISNFHFLDLERKFSIPFRRPSAYRSDLSFPLPSSPYSLPSLLTAATTRADTSVPPHSSSPSDPSPRFPHFISSPLFPSSHPYDPQRMAHYGFGFVTRPLSIATRLAKRSPTASFVQTGRRTARAFSGYAAHLTGLTDDQHEVSRSFRSAPHGQ